VTDKILINTHNSGINIGPLLFIIYINDLPPTINTLAIPIIFADDTSVIISSKNLHVFCLLSNRVVSLMCRARISMTCHIFILASFHMYN
jgi:hypothetical protein